MRRCLYNAKSYRVGMKELRLHTYAALFREMKGRGVEREYTMLFVSVIRVRCLLLILTRLIHMLSKWLVTAIELSSRFALSQLTSFRYYVDAISMPRLHTESL
jgi:hypothetical protein